MAKVYSVGYSGHDGASFLRLLEEAGVAVVLDVRERPVSRKPGFSQRRLRDSLEAAGMGYEHLPELGAPRAVRDAYHGSGDVHKFRAAYAIHLRGEHEALARLAAIAHRHTAAIMCLEGDPTACHRFVLAQRLRGDGFEVRDLAPGPGAEGRPGRVR